MRVIKETKRIATMKVMNESEEEFESSFFSQRFIFRVLLHTAIRMALVGKKMVEQMIKSKALVVISKSYCPFCHKVIFYIIFL